MYVVRCRELDEGKDSVLKTLDDFVDVLDTDDGIVERYKLRDLVLNEEISHSLYGCSITSSPLVYSVGNFKFKSIFKHKIYVDTIESRTALVIYDDYIIFCSTESRYNVGDGRSIELRQGGIYTIASINLNMAPFRYLLHILWACKVGNIGYRLVLEMEISAFGDLNFKYRDKIRIYMFVFSDMSYAFEKLVPVTDTVASLKVHKPKYQLDREITAKLTLWG